MWEAGQCPAAPGALARKCKRHLRSLGDEVLHVAGEAAHGGEVLLVEGGLRRVELAQAVHDVDAAPHLAVVQAQHVVAQLHVVAGLGAVRVLLELHRGNQPPVAAVFNEAWGYM